MEESGEWRGGGKGHRATAAVETAEGGSFCLLCFANLLSDDAGAPSHHVSFALSQLSRAMAGLGDVGGDGVGGGRGGSFARELRAVHGHLLVLPLVHVLSSYDDEPLARQTLDLVSDLCDNSRDRDRRAPCESLTRDFVARIADRLSSGALAWSRRQLFMLHCLGVLLDRGGASNPSSYIRNKADLVQNLVTGLRLPSEEIRGEILFVLYKLFSADDRNYEDNDHDDDDALEEYLVGFKLMRLSLEVLLKTQNDDVRTNCIAFLTVLVRRGCFDDIARRRTAELDSEALLVSLFADAIKAPLLSSDTRVQIGTLDLVFYSLSTELFRPPGDIDILIEENIADYVFEILRLSGNKDPLIISCLRVLELMIPAEDKLKQRLAVGFPTLLAVLRYVADIPLHPVQCQAMKLVWLSVSSFPGLVSMSQAEELAVSLTGMFARYRSGEFGMLSETFVLGCLTFVETFKAPSSHQTSKLSQLVREMLNNAVLSSLSVHCTSDRALLYSLYLAKEALLYSEKENAEEIADCVVEICKTHLLPWLGSALERGREEEEYTATLETLEIFHLLLLQESAAEQRKTDLAESLASSRWISRSFGLLALFPSAEMKARIYLLLSSLLDCILGPDFGDPIREACESLPADPVDLLFLLGRQNISGGDDLLLSCQSAVFAILHSTTLLDERVSEDEEILAAVEQFILANHCIFSWETNAGRLTLAQLVHLYSFARGVLSPSSDGSSHSEEAERILFRLINDHDWALLVSIGVHPTALKWLLQQRGGLGGASLCGLILDFCRYLDDTWAEQLCERPGRTMTTMTARRGVDVRLLSDLVVAGDNGLASILVLLLGRLESQEDDLGRTINAILMIMVAAPQAAAQQFCSNGIAGALRDLCQSRHASTNSAAVWLLALNVLGSAPPQALSICGDAAWLPICVKVSESVSSLLVLAEESVSPAACLGVGILCLVLHRAATAAGVLGEAAKAVVLNAGLISAVDLKIQAACAKGPALADRDQESLLLVLLLYLFSVGSFGAVATGWEELIWAAEEGSTEKIRAIRVSCVDLCRLLHYGPRAVKLTASQSLAEILPRIPAERLRRLCPGGRLGSMMAVVEGLVFYEDPRVAANCALCWETLRAAGAGVGLKWSRLITEELAPLLLAPGLPSAPFKARHGPAARVAKALLAHAREGPPAWAKSLFRPSSLAGIAANLGPASLTPEMVALFRELALARLLDDATAARLARTFQACRKRLYKDFSEQPADSPIFISGDEQVSALLLRLKLSAGDRSIPARLLEEIDRFFEISRPQT
ncbi:protein PUTATIVE RECOMBINATION INITIATION DEFECT 1-like [Wolffia australiana]